MLIIEQGSNAEQTTKPISFYTDSPIFSEVPWLDRAKGSERQGLLNPELFSLLVKQEQLIGFYNQKPYFNFFKRATDIIISLGALIVLSPLFLLLSILVVMDSKGWPFYTQIRAGHYFKPFYIFKFRSMTSSPERAVKCQNEMVGGLFKMRKDPRVTRVGKLLRRTSLDELPQLVNVLLGDMSLVGPRPLPLPDSSTISERYAVRFAAKPGLTGLWQATIRDSQNGEHKIALDAEYSIKRSLFLDLRIVFQTIFTVISGKGAW